MLKIAVLAPTPIASVSIATAAKPFAFQRFRRAYFRSCTDVRRIGVE
jgi:hypothetical protein